MRIICTSFLCKILFISSYVLVCSFSIFIIPSLYLFIVIYYSFSYFYLFIGLFYVFLYYMIAALRPTQEYFTHTRIMTGYPVPFKQSCELNIHLHLGNSVIELIQIFRASKSEIRTCYLFITLTVASGL